MDHLRRFTLSCSLLFCFGQALAHASADEAVEGLVRKIDRLKANIEKLSSDLSDGRIPNARAYVKAVDSLAVKM